MKWQLTILLAVGLWGALGLTAQTGNPPVAEFTFTVFKDSTEPIAGVFFQRAGGREQELTFRRSQRSFAFEYQGAPEMVFYRRAKDAEGNDIKVPVAMATVPIEWKQVMMFFFPNPRAEEGGPEFFVYPMNDSVEALPVDHLIFFNATGAPLLGVFGTQEIQLGMGAAGPFDLRPFLDATVPIGLVVKDGETFRKVYVSRLSFSQGSRVILLLMPPRREGSYRIMVRGIYDFSASQDGGSGSGATDEP